MMNRRKTSGKRNASTRKSHGLKPAGSEVANAVLATRKARGIAQTELAKRVGLTRQAMYAIEANQYLPSTSIALRLAQVLGCRVEDLFWLATPSEVVEAELFGHMIDSARPFRVKMAQVGDRLVAKPLSELGDMLNFVVSADGIASRDVPSGRKLSSRRVRVELLGDIKDIQKHVLIAGCDPSLFLAGNYVRQGYALADITNWTMGSTDALRALLQGEVHVAGVHLVDARSGESNIPYLKRHVRGTDFLGVRFASWVQGFVLQPGNPRNVQRIEDLAQPGIRLINREAGAGARQLLDYLLKKAGMVGRQIEGYAHEAASHLDVARGIRDGMGDVGIGVEAAARHFGLYFVPLREERYDLIFRKDALAVNDTMAKFLDAMVSRPFRQELQILGGYDLSESGKTLSW